MYVYEREYYKCMYLCVRALYVYVLYMHACVWSQLCIHVEVTDGFQVSCFITCWLIYLRQYLKLNLELPWYPQEQ